MNEVRDRNLSQQTQYWFATYLLMGMIHTKGFVQALLQGVRQMHQSMTHETILRKAMELGYEKGLVLGYKLAFELGFELGRMLQAKETVLTMGSKRFGTPDARHVELIESISDRKRVDELKLRLFEVTGWDELLGE